MPDVTTSEGIRAIVAQAVRDAVYAVRQKQRTLRSRAVNRFGEINWREIDRLDAGMLRANNGRRHTKYIPMIKAALQLPRDGTWYEIVIPGRHDRREMKSRCLALRRWLHERLEYPREVVNVRYDSGAIYARWKARPAAPAPSVVEVETVSAVQLREMEVIEDEEVGQQSGT